MSNWATDLFVKAAKALSHMPQQHYPALMQTDTFAGRVKFKPGAIVDRTVHFEARADAVRPDRYNLFRIETGVYGAKFFPKYSFDGKQSKVSTRQFNEKGPVSFEWALEVLQRIEQDTAKTAGWSKASTATQHHYSQYAEKTSQPPKPRPDASTRPHGTPVTHTAG